MRICLSTVSLHMFDVEQLIHVLHCLVGGDDAGG